MLDDNSNYRIQITASDIAGNSSDPSFSASDFQINNTPHLVGFAFYFDSNFNSIADLGDQMGLAFDTDVSGSAVGEDFRLPIVGNSLGAGASVGNGARPNEITLNLGNNPLLKTRGVFQSFMAGVNDRDLPTGLDILTPVTTLTNPASGYSASPSQFVDVIPGLALQNIEEDVSIGDNIAIDFGDITMDGKMDIVGISAETGTANYLLWIWKSDPQLQAFIPKVITQNIGSVPPTVVKLSDVDRDGDLDVFIGFSSGSAQVKIHNGDREFDPYTTFISFGAGNVLAVDAGNLNRDGDNDFVYSVSGSGVYQIRSNGAGGFGLPSLVTSSATDEVILSDIDKDGDLDLMLFYASGHSIWRNAGQGSFSLSQSISAASFGAAVAGDLNDDGYPDLIFSGVGNGVQIWSNNGSGTYVYSGSIPFAGTVSDIAIFNLNGDRLNEIAFSIYGDRDRVYVNQGSMNFTDSGMPLDGIEGDNRTIALVVKDFNLDADDDLAVASVQAGAVGILHGSLSGTWGRLVLTKGIAPKGEDNLDWQIASVGDVNGDQIPDVMMRNFSSSSELMLGQGDGTFSTSQTMRGISNDAHRFADLDRDGDLDMIIGNEVHLNTGGVFSIATSLGANTARAVEAIDVDRDGDLDIVIGRSSGADIYVNNGQTQAFIGFTYIRTIASPTIVDVIKKIKANSDGAPDLLISGAGESLSCWTNNGAGIFSGINLTAFPSGVRFIEIGDVNRDGTQDIFASQYGSNGTSAAIGIQTSFGGCGSISLQASGRGAGGGLGDIDSDGDPDWFLRPYEDFYGFLRPTDVYLNDNNGAYPKAPFTLHSFEASGKVLFGDFDLDGDVDIVDRYNIFRSR